MIFFAHRTINRFRLALTISEAVVRTLTFGLLALLTLGPLLP
jgi:hypothetical protein